MTYGKPPTECKRDSRHSLASCEPSAHCSGLPSESAPHGAKLWHHLRVVLPLRHAQSCVQQAVGKTATGFSKLKRLNGCMEQSFSRRQDHSSKLSWRRPPYVNTQRAGSTTDQSSRPMAMLTGADLGTKQARSLQARTRPPPSIQTRTNTHAQKRERARHWRARP